MVDFEFTAESTARTKHLVPRSMTFILHLLSVVAGAGMFIFRKLEFERKLQQRSRSRYRNYTINVHEKRLGAMVLFDLGAKSKTACFMK